MTVRRIFSSLLLAALLLTTTTAAHGEDKKSAAAFLDPANWEGLEYWKLDGDMLTGTSPAPTGLKFNTFFCSKQKYKDFELGFKVKLTGTKWDGNSGVQIRSKIHDQAHFAVTGPQCDMGSEFWGSLYGENFGGMMKAADKAVVAKVLKKDDFNDYAIKCVGKHVTIMLNGETTVDQEFEKLPEDGIIAWQMHGGPPMEVIFKNIRFKDLSAK